MFWRKVSGIDPLAVFVVICLVVVGVMVGIIVKDECEYRRREQIEKEYYQAKRKEEEERLRQYKQRLSGFHKVRKMTVEKDTVMEATLQTSARYFILVGGSTSNYRQSLSSVSYVVFAWEYEPNEFIISKVPLEKVKFRIHPKNYETKVEFIFKEEDLFSDEVEKCIKQLRWLVIHISEEEWPIEISLPFNGPFNGVSSSTSPTMEMEVK
jgi:hypothetical protein